MRIQGEEFSPVHCEVDNTPYFCYTTKYAVCKLRRRCPFHDSTLLQQIEMYKRGNQGVRLKVESNVMFQGNYRVVTATLTIGGLRRVSERYPDRRNEYWMKTIHSILTNQSWLR